MNIDIVTTIIVLKHEIDYLKTLIQPSATGHIYTAISVLESRISDLKESVTEVEKSFLILKGYWK